MTKTNRDLLVLIVDDSPTNLKLLMDSLSQAGLNVAVAKNGEQALKQVQKTKPDLILLDVLMPGIDGFETCRELKRIETVKDIPVIFMTALDDTENIIHGFEVGGVDYIVKPIRVKEVLIRVQTHLKQREMQLQLEAQNAELQEALYKIKTLKGLLPICANCKKIRDDEGYWNRLENYIESHSEALFTHGLCPECMEEMFGKEKWYRKKKSSEEQRNGAKGDCRKT